MISAGSEVPNISHACDLTGTRGRTLGQRRTAAAPAFALLSLLLLQGCGNSDTRLVAEAEQAMPRPATIAAETIVPRGVRTAEDSFADRFHGDSFADRFAPVMTVAQQQPARPKVATASLQPAQQQQQQQRRDAALAPAPVRERVTASQAGREMAFAPQPTREMVFAPELGRDSVFAPAREMPADRKRAATPNTFRVAALSPVLPLPEVRPATKQAYTSLIGFENSAFPFPGKNPRTGNGSRYGDNRVLVHVPNGFDARKPGVIVVFFHGHGATLERDVRDRQSLPRQISESGVNAALVAPQLAYDAADSSAGKFWERDGFKRFMAEAAEQLARAYGDPRSVDAFANMPVVVVAYSGGFETAAWSLHHGGLGKRVTGVVLLDALYGHLEKFSSWISKNRQAFFISSYTTHNKRRDDDLAQMLRAKDIPVQYELNGPLKPGTAAFLSMGDSVRHRDFVTLAWTANPVKDVLVRMAQR